jgi:hypothetical protein
VLEEVPSAPCPRPPTMGRTSSSTPAGAR